MQRNYYNKVNWGSSFKKSTLFLFFVWPLSALFVAFRNYKQNYSKNIVWFFCIFFGFLFIVADYGGADSDRYARTFIKFAHSDLSLSELWAGFYEESSTYVDIVSPLISFLVSRFTDNPSILFAVFGFIFGYFYSRNIWFVLNKIEGKLSIILFLFILTYILLNPIWNINGFRYYTAAQIFLFGALHYIFEGKSKYLVWAGTSIFVHFSFLSAFFILGLFLLFKNRLNLYLMFFVVTSFISEIDLLQVQSYLSFLPGVLYDRVTVYTNPEYAETRASYNWSLFIPLSEDGLRWIVYAFTLIICFFHRHLVMKELYLTKFLCFSLLFYGFANIFSLIPSGARFYSVANSLMFAFIIMFMIKYSKIRGLPLIEILSLPLLLLFCIVSLRIGMDRFGLMTIISNPLLALLYKDTTPLYSIITNIL